MKFSAEGLAKAGLDLTAPLIVDLRLDPAQDIEADPVAQLQLTSIERVLPGRRASGFGVCQGRRVFAKLFYGAGARRYWRRELTGAAYLQTSQVATPLILKHGAFADGKAYFVFYEPLHDARQLHAEDDADLREAVLMLARLHESNLIQSDVHVGNFLRCGAGTYVVDADGIRRAHLLRQQFANLGQLLAQRHPVHDVAIDALWETYARERGDYVSRMGSVDVAWAATADQRRRRVNRYLAKTQRECTEFVHRQGFRFAWLCQREYARRLQRFIVSAEQIFATGTLLKAGNSATVVRIVLDGERFIVKRYNIKSFTHRVRRWFKRRARNAWRNGHRLAFLGVPTARPIALLETRWGWFAGVSYLIMPDGGDRSLGEALAGDASLFDDLAPRAVDILLRLKAAGLEHGDLKATNFVLMDRDLILIDYDAVRPGQGTGDVLRFLANWHQDGQLLSRWQTALEEAKL